MSTTTQPINIPSANNYIKNSKKNYEYNYEYKNENISDNPNNTPDENAMWKIKLEYRIKNYELSRVNNLNKILL